MRRGVGAVLIALLLLPLLLTRPHDLAQAQTDGDHNWLTETATAATDLDSQYIALAVDSAYQPHVAYRRGGDDGGLFYAVRDADGWQTQQVTADPAGGQFTAIAVDANDVPVVAHTDGTTVWVHRLGEEGWTETVVNPNPMSLAGPLRLAANGGELHLTYGALGAVYYAQSTSNGWSTPEQVAAVEGSGRLTHALALDAAGDPHVAYQRAFGQVAYKSRGSSGWDSEEIFDEGNFVGEFLSLAVDDSGAPHVTYLAEDVLAYAVRGSDGWSEPPESLDVVSSVDNVALDGQIMLFADGQPAISYSDNNDGGVYFAVRQESDVWQPEPVEGGVEIGGVTAMVVDDKERPHLVYFDFAEAAPALRYAVWNWAPTAADDSASLWVDGARTIPLLANDVDRDERPLTPQIITEPQHGSVFLTPEGAAVYVPQRGYRGADQFTYEIIDHGGLRASATASLTVFVPTLIFTKETEQWIPLMNGSRIRLELTDGTAVTWAGIEYFNFANGRWQTVKAANGEDGWHGTADRMNERPWTQTWWVGRSQLGTGPYRWVVYSAPGGYARTYSEPFFLPDETNRMLILNGRVR